MAKLNEEDLISILRRSESEGQNWQDSELQALRQKAFDYYDRKPYGDEEEGQSKVVTSEFADTVESIMPGMMRVFASGEDIAEFQPIEQGDEDAAKEASQLVPHVMMRENDGFRILYWLIKDALMYRLSSAVVDTEERERTRKEPIEAWTDEQMAMAAQLQEEKGATEVAFEVQPDRPGKETHKAVDYDEGMGDDRCKNCVYYTGAGCILVEDPIAPDMWCRLFSMRPEGMPLAVDQPMTYSGTLTTTKKKKCVVIDNVAPEDLLVAPANIRDIDQASYAGYRKRVTASELRVLGLSQEAIDGLNADRYSSPEEDQRQDGQSQYNNRTDSERPLWVVVAYVRVDVNDDGISEMLRVIYAHAGGTAGAIIEQDEWEDGEVPITIGSVIMMSHNLIGRSLFDQTVDLQDVGTAVTRGILNNIYLTNRPRPAINGRVNINSVLDHTPGMPMQVMGSEDPARAISWLQVPSIIAPGLTVMEYLNAVRENRTGVIRNNQGLEANALQNDTAAGLNMLMTAGQQRQELMARVLAATAITRLMRHIYRAIKRAATGPVSYFANDDWQQADPTKWPDDMHLVVSVGTGTGNKQQEQQSLMMIGAGQEKLVQAQGGVDGPVVNLENMANTFRRLVEASGFRATSQFVASTKELKQAEAQPKQPQMSPEILKVQADAAAAQAKLQAETALKQKQLQADIALKREQAAADMQIAREQAALDMQTAREKAALEDRLAREKAALDAELKRQELELEAEIERYKVDNMPDPGNTQLREQEVSG